MNYIPVPGWLVLYAGIAIGVEALWIVWLHWRLKRGSKG